MREGISAEKTLCSDFGAGNQANVRGKSDGGFAEGGQTSESNARAAVEDAFPKIYRITVINPAYPATNTPKTLSNF